MEWGLDLRIGLVEFVHLVVTIVLAYLVAKIGWRFTNVRAAKDLVLEEGRRSLQVCDKIRKNLRKMPDSDIPKHEDFSEHLDDLGNYLHNCIKLYHGISDKSQSEKTDDLSETFHQLRVALSGDTSKKDQDTPNAVMRLRIVESKIVDLMVDVNSLAHQDSRKCVRKSAQIMALCCVQNYKRGCMLASYIIPKKKETITCTKNEVSLIKPCLILREVATFQCFLRLNPCTKWSKTPNHLT